MSCSSDLNSFRDGRLVAEKLLLCGILLPGFVQYDSKNSCIISVKLFSIRLVSVHVVPPYSRIDTLAAWKNCFLSYRASFTST